MTSYCVSKFQETGACSASCAPKDVDQLVVNAKTLCTESLEVGRDATVGGSMTVGGASSQLARTSATWSAGIYFDVNEVAVGAPAYPVGSKYSDGARTYRYAEVPVSTAIAAGAVVQSQPVTPTTYYQPDVQPEAAAVGDAAVTFKAASAVDKDAFAGGTLHISDNPTTAHQGYTYRIKSNTAAASGAPCTLTLYDESRLAQVLSGADQITVIANIYKNVAGAFTNAAAPVGYALGFACAAVPSNANAKQYLWLQTRGPGTGIVNAGNAPGLFVIGQKVFTATVATTAGGLAIGLDASASAANYNNPVWVGNALESKQGVAGEGVAVLIGGNIPA